MGFLRWLRGFVVDQRCIPWRLHVWMGRHCPRLLIFLKTGRTNVNTPRHWDRKWEEVGPDGARWCRFPKKFARICELVAPRARVLDVGCGVGILLDMLRDRKDCACTGLDISPTAIAMVEAKGMRGVVATLPEMPLDDASFDAAVATELIEHLSRPERTLHEIARVTRPGGTIILSTPNEDLRPEDTVEHLNAYDTRSLARFLGTVAEDVHVEVIEEDGFEADFLLAWGTKPVGAESAG
ncbi:MAG: class I SAM-dependent methyltransferase [bacterium]